MSNEKKPTGLELLRTPFSPNQISKLPKPTKWQTSEVKDDVGKGIRCDLCGGWHHPKVTHLDYVGHAALTDRLLDCDPEWNWEPMALGEKGLPLMDGGPGMWIKLTVCGVTRLGYGDAAGKTGGNAVKEVIGDALRNAAMRFGAALDLWHKGDLHDCVDDDCGTVNNAPKKQYSWANTVTEDMPENSTPREKAVAIAAALCAQFRRMKGERQISNEWDRRAAIITELETKHNDLWGNVIDAYENRLMEIKGTD